MIAVELVADTNVLSYLFRQSSLGVSYRCLIGERPVGVTGLTLAEIHFGAAIGGWGRRKIEELKSFLNRFTHVPDTEEIAEICGHVRAQHERVGRAISWPDACAAASALWLQVPLVTHDRDHEGIPGLQVLTLHDDWRIGEEHALCDEEHGAITALRGGGPLWLGESERRVALRS
jgi:predicted nucleic acid-binding protein